MCAAGTMSRNDRLRRTRPIVNLTGLDGSRGPSRTHIHAKTGAKRSTNSGSTDWNQLDGYMYRKIVRRVARSAKRFRLDPACSNPAQNISAKNERMAMAPMRIQSSRFSDGFGVAADSINTVFGVFIAERATRYFFPATY